MIWLKKGHYLIGYVPQLDKVYTEEEIRTINSHCDSDDWCKLSKLIMMTQGIAFEYDGGLYKHPKTNALPLNMIKFNFDFECLPKPRSINEEHYLKDIHNVFTHLKLYKVDTRLSQRVYEEIVETKAHWSYFVSETTISDIWRDYNYTVENAYNARLNLLQLRKAFSKSGLHYPKIFCNEAPEFDYKAERTSDVTYTI